MKYWLHRITGGDNALPYVKPLLGQGFLSIGWKGLSNDENKNSIQERGWSAVNDIMLRYGWELGRSRYCLSRFISEMRSGDLVVVPASGNFSIYEIIDDVVYSNEFFDPRYFVDSNGIRASRIEGNGYYSFVNNLGEEIDLGFYRRVKPRIINKSRYEGVDPLLYAKLRTLMTNIDISDIGSVIDDVLRLERPFHDVGIIESVKTNNEVAKINRPEVFIISDLLDLDLSIPNYQRPYVWSTENVEHMLNDIKTSMDQGKESYRLGSLILHESNLVDGQQRVTTLYLLKIALGEVLGRINDLDCNLKYNHNQSFEHIKANYAFIKNWLQTNPNNLSFEDYLDHHCECLVIRITGEDGLAIAFRLFDSQNGRGKPLEPYNLLKAFHLRAMDGQPSEEKVRCDRKWEQATRYNKSPRETSAYDILKHLFDEQLYRSRIWSHNKEAWSFSKKRIDEFKGMSIDKYHNPLYPFQNHQLLLYMTEKFYQGFLLGTMPTRSRFTDNDDFEISPFTQVNQPIVNGKDFFEYIQTYVEIYKRLFIELDSYQLKDFKSFYKKHCLEYNGHWRKGDNYVREMYKSLVLCLFDKFGEEVLNKYHKVLYLRAYIVRRVNKKVFYQTVAKHPQELFSIIYNAKSEADLVALQNGIEWKPEKVFDDFTEYESVIEEINEENKQRKP